MLHSLEAMAGLANKRQRSSSGHGSDDNNGGTAGSHGLGSLTGMDVVHHAFLFLDGPADVLRAAIACQRWRELACADAVWREKAVREGMVEKARVFEVALPAATTVGSGGGGSDGINSGRDASSTFSSSGAATATKKEGENLAGLGLPFYAQVYVLKVLIAQLVLTVAPLVHMLIAALTTTTTTTARTRCRSHSLGRGTK